MTIYTALADAEIDTDSPITESVMTRLRDNPIAITEGASGAPKNTKESLDNDVSPWILLETGTASASSTIDFETLGSYEHYKIVLKDFKATTGATNLYLRVGTGATPTYVTGISYHYHASDISTISAAYAALVSTASSAVLLNGTAIASGATHAVNGEINIINPHSTNYLKKIFGNISYIDTAGTAFTMSQCVGGYNATTAVTAFRLMYSSGTIASGTAKLYGMKA